MTVFKSDMNYLCPFCLQPLHSSISKDIFLNCYPCHITFFISANRFDFDFDFFDLSIRLHMLLRPK